MKQNKGFFAHFFLTGLLIFVFFGKLIPDINNLYFSRDGDGFRTYFGMYYHAKFDTSYHRLDGMNYPFGEMIDFTDCQPPVSNFIQFVSKHIVDISGYTTGIVNGTMLFSIFLASIFLFLIFRKLKLPNWFASAVSICIVFLSPQIHRMGGHFSLGWMFWIPLSIYLLMLFDDKKSYWISLLVGISAFLAGAMHFYMLAFWLFLFAPYWLFRWVMKADYKFSWEDLIHVFIQIVLPFILLEINLIVNDDVVDRTANPWGFYTYRGHFAAVFLPLFKWYIPFSNNLSFAQKFDWEAFSYIGIVASVGFFLLTIRWIKGVIKLRKMTSITGNKILDYLLAISFLVLLFSFGVPFIFGLDKLRSFLGPLGQLRGVARFGWMFFYVINIIVFYLIYNKLFLGKKGFIGKIITFSLLSVFAFEAWVYSGGYQNNLNNRIPELENENDHFYQSLAALNIDTSKYQAILPLPYFHIGSESSWIDNRCDIMKHSFILSMKTGIPNVGMMGARTSILQSYKNIELVRTPWVKFRVLDEYPNNKPLLLTVAKCDELNSDEKRLVENASFLMNTPNFDLYEMPIDTLRAIPAKYNFPQRYSNMVDSIKRSIVEGKTDCFFESNGNLNCGTEKLKGIKVSNDFQRILETPVKLDLSKKVYIRFWVKDYAKDMVVRTPLLIIQDKTNHEFLEEKYSDIWRHIRSFNGDWALVEIVLEPKQEDEIIKLLFKNSILDGQDFYFDEFSVSQKEF